MCSFVRSKQHQRWLWHAIEHQSAKVLAYVLATHEDAALKQLQQLLALFSIERFYTDSWAAYLRLLDEQHHTVGKANTQLFFLDDKSGVFVTSTTTTSSLASTFWSCFFPGSVHALDASSVSSIL